jgi:hypothetical protein
MDRRGTNADQHLIVCGQRLVDVPKLEDVG